MPDTRPCEACKADVLFAEHVVSRKPAPLVPAPEGVTPNIAIQFDDAQQCWTYSIPKKTDTETVRTHINHFADCPGARQFGKKANAK